MYTIDDIVTSSMQMEIIKERIGMIADTDSSVLIYGETGTGALTIIIPSMKLYRFKICSAYLLSMLSISLCSLFIFDYTAV